MLREIREFHTSEESNPGQHKVLSAIVGWFQKRSKVFSMTVGVLLVLLIGVIDYYTGTEVSFSIFFLFPIAFVTSLVGRWSGILLYILSALVWYIADTTAGHVYSYPLIPVWNASVRLGYFSITTFFLSALQNRLRFEKILSRKDSLTGVSNDRGFYDWAEKELERAKRYQRPFSLAYIDLDNFKSVNDSFGHNEGSYVLSVVGKILNDNVRSTDIVGRMGGDEYAIFFPETGQDLAKATVSRIVENLLDVMRKNNWPVTFSIGVATFITYPGSVDEALRNADSMMYEIKNSGKNNVKYEIIGSAQAITK